MPQSAVFVLRSRAPPVAAAAALPGACALAARGRRCPPAGRRPSRPRPTRWSLLKAAAAGKARRRRAPRRPAAGTARAAGAIARAGAGRAARAGLDAKALAAGRRTARQGQPRRARPDAHWSYDGEAGPATWAQLKPEFALCAAGTAPEPDRHPRRHRGRPRAGALRLPAGGFAVVDNGHTVQVNVARGQHDRGHGPALRAAAVPLPPPVRGAHQRPPVRDVGAPGAQGPARPAGGGGGAARARRRAAGGAAGLEQPAAGKATSRWRRRDDARPGRAAARPTAATSPTWAR